MWTWKQKAFIGAMTLMMWREIAPILFFISVTIKLNSMKTANKLVYSKVNYYTENGYEYKIKTTISLDDDCHNNMCDWSITADIRWKNKYGIYKEYMGGCCHDEIARHCPELAKFIPLHCCDHYGAPMYPVENGMYHIKNSDKSVAIEYLRISDKEYSKSSEAVDDKMYFKYLLFNLGIVDRWKRESGELIAELENLCGKKWVNQYKPEEERFTLTLTDEERLLIEERIKAGYYSAENIEKRREEAHKAKMMEKRAEICEQYDMAKYFIKLFGFDRNECEMLLDKNGSDDKMESFIIQMVFNKDDKIILDDIGYHKIGSIFKYNIDSKEVELEVVESSDASCEGCAFNNSKNYYCKDTHCIDVDRKDDIDVIYKKVKRS
nr:MAG: hypothetical protein [Bacteriophage sp.]